MKHVSLKLKTVDSLLSILPIRNITHIHVFIFISNEENLLCSYINIKEKYLLPSYLAQRPSTCHIPLSLPFSSAGAGPNLIEIKKKYKWMELRVCIFTPI